MKQFSKDLGRVSVVPSGAWNSDIEYEKLSVVYDKCTNLSYLAKQSVPVGASIDNREYWQPMNVSGYADNNFINLTTVSKDGMITAYENINEAIVAVVEINRKPGAVLSFYNINSDRLDAQPEFELWQFNSTDLTNWENEEYWNNIYFNWNVFVGWYVGADALKKHVANPNVGQYAYVGTSLNDALLYQCRTNGTWTNTDTKVRDHISVVVKGNVEIGSNGNWFSNGKDTGIPATPKVDETLDSITKTLANYQQLFDNQTLINKELNNNIKSNKEIIVKNQTDIVDINNKIATFVPVTNEYINSLIIE